MGKVLAKRALQPHPDAGQLAINIGAKLMLLGSDVLRIEYVLTGDLNAIVLPSPRIGARRDELWRHTCFEAFLRTPGGEYLEFNFAPSTDWAAYRFDGYRDGMQPLLKGPDLHVERGAGRFGLTAHVELPTWPEAMNLTAVIESRGGTRSYWALAHPDGPPDFHDPACFVLELPAPG